MTIPPANPEGVAPEAPQAPAAPTTFKIGDKELSPVEIEEALALKSEVQEYSQKHGDWKLLKQAFTEKATKVAELEKLTTKVEEIAAGDKSAGSLTEGELKDVEYLKKLGFISKEEAKALQDRLEEVSSKMTAEEKAKADKTKAEEEAQVRKELKELEGKHEFIKSDELLDYMIEQAEKHGKKLSPVEAARLKYFDNFVKTGEKPTVLPTLDKSAKADMEGPKPKVPALGSAEQRQIMSEMLRGGVE